MSSHRRLQKKNSKQSPLPTSQDIFSPRPFDSGRPARDGRLPETNILQSRPFAPKAQKSAPAQPNSVEQVEAAQQFGYKALSLNPFAPSEQLQSDSKEEAALEIGEEESGWGLEASSQQPTAVSPQEETIQRLCDECAAEEKEETEEEKATETIQAKVEEGIEQAKGSGESLDLSVRQPMESAFGADFSGVKIHTDSTSDKLNKSIQAKAFTTGKDIFFKAGEYQPHNREGKELIAHELTHVVQQTGAIQPKSIGKITKKDNKLQAKEISATEKQVIQRKANPQAATPSPHAKGGGTASLENDAGFQGVTNRIKQVAQKEKTHPPATTKSTEAQGAAVPPSNEVTSKAQNRQVEEMNQQQPGKFNAAAFKAALMEKIAAITPQTLEEADNFKNNNKIESVKGDLSSQVSQEKKQAANPIEDKAKEAPNPSGIPAKPVTPLPPNQLGAPTPDIGASNAAPKPKSEAEVSLKEGSQSLDKQMTDAKVTEEQLAKSNEPQFQGALDAKKTAQTQANTAPPIYRQEEKATLTKAGGEAQIAAQTQLQGMHGEHAQILAQVLGTQGKTKGQDEQKRAEVANHIQGIYNSTKQNVEKSLGDLDKEVNQEFDQGTAAAKTEFENYVKQRMDAYKEERYSGVIGAGKWVKDKLFGMPSEVNVFYQEGKKQYLASMGKTIDKIANLVATKLNTAKAEIAKGKQEIQKYVTSLPQDLRQVGQEAAQNIQGQFDELEQSVDNKQNELVDSLAQKYNENLQAIDAKIEEMKAENRGLVDKATDAIAGTIKTIMQLKDMLMGVLAKAASAVEKIILDPIGFLGNLVSGIRQGFDNFVGNIITHLQTGLMGWLTGAMGALGLQLPDDIFSLQGIFSLVTQILGTTWNYIRMKAVKMFGEPIVNGMEKTVEIFQIIANKGPMGLWEHVQEHFNDLKETVIEEIKGMLITQVITAGVKWIIGLLNPASAFVKAAMAIYDIVMFFINQGSQVVELVSAVTDAVVAIASGAVGGAAKLVENALAKSLPVVIGFLASLLGIGDLAKKVQGIVGKIRQRIDLAIDWVLGKAVASMKKLGGKLGGSKLGKKLKAGVAKAKDLKDRGVKKFNDLKEKGKKKFQDLKEKAAKKLGFGKGKDNKDNKAHEDSKLKDTEVGKTINFNAKGESHRLWISTQGTSVTVMVASSPGAVEAKLNEWEGKLDTLAEDKRPQAKTLLATARQHLGNTEKEAQEAAKEIQEAKQKPNEQAVSEAEQADNQAEAAEQVLAQTMQQLFHYFGDQDSKLAEFFGVKEAFNAGNAESHSIYYEDRGGQPTLIVASTPRSIYDFLNFYTNEYDVKPESPKGKLIAEIRKYLKQEIEPVVKQVNAAEKKKDTATQNSKQRELLDKNKVLSGKLRDLLAGDRDVGKIIDSYLLEGLTGTYSGMPNPHGDQLTPDHQPQAAILEWAAKQQFFGATSNMKLRATGRAAQGYAINLYAKRHMEGRTYGNKGSQTKDAFINKAKSDLAGVNTNQEKRDIVVDLLKVELDADVKTMKDVVGGSNTKSVWDDIHDLDITKKEKNDLINKIRTNILSGENQIASQDMESLKQ